jgi:hypothetical protein
MKIVILGWGSLIWDRRGLAITGDWQRGGPMLPIEFSRISRGGERAGCLTLVIDEQHGANIPTRFALSTRANLDDAIADLRTREGTSSDRIGYVNLLRNTERAYARQQHPHACDAITAWAQAQRWDAVVWTALHSNFEEVAQHPFSVEAAILYLKALIEPAKSHALEYLQKAPPEVVTPVRTAAIQAGLIKSADSENQTEIEDAESMDDDDDGDEDQYPWEDVDKARHNRRLQRNHPPGEADKYRGTAKPCPMCGKVSRELAWFYFESPKRTWENLCGRAGWMTVCDACHVQVDFFLEVMN